MVCSGKLTFKQIGERYGITPGRVGQIADAMDTRLRESIAERVEQIKVRQTHELRLLYREAIEQWERSKRDAEQVKTTEGDDTGKAGGNRTERTVKGQCGDPRYLSVAQGVLGDIRKIWGAEAPVKSETKATVSVEPLDKRVEMVNARLRAALGRVIDGTET